MEGKRSADVVVELRTHRRGVVSKIVVDVVDDDVAIAQIGLRLVVALHHAVGRLLVHLELHFGIVAPEADGAGRATAEAGIHLVVLAPGAALVEASGIEEHRVVVNHIGAQLVETR